MGAVEVRNPNSQTFVIERIFEITKPHDDWNFKETTDPSAPVKWVLHRGGANPVILLRFDYSPPGKSIANFADSVRSELVRRGLRIDREEPRSINGRKAYLFYATDRNLRGNASYLVGVFRNKSRGWIVECNSVPVDFNMFEHQFLSAINSVRIYRDY